MRISDMLRFYFMPKFSPNGEYKPRWSNHPIKRRGKKRGHLSLRAQEKLIHVKKKMLQNQYQKIRHNRAFIEEELESIVRFNVFIGRVIQPLELLNVLKVTFGFEKMSSSIWRSHFLLMSPDHHTRKLSISHFGTN